MSIFSKAANSERLQVATFWEGPMMALEKACLMSFANRGHDVTFYSFTKESLDPSIKWVSAGRILEREYLARFITDGKPNLAHFADLFRLALFQKTEATWVDCDVLLMGDKEQSPWPRQVLVSEDADHIINCVLRIDDPKTVAEAIRLTRQFFDKDVPWAATQYVIPKAMEFSGEHFQLSPAAEFCPFGADEWFKPLLPEYADECEQQASSARTLHLYNNILQKVGYHKDVAPPVGSYLSNVLKQEGLLELFTGVYPADTVRNLSEGWKLRFSAQAAGFGAIARQILPSFQRTIARRSIR